MTYWLKYNIYVPKIDKQSCYNIHKSVSERYVYQFVVIHSMMGSQSLNVRMHRNICRCSLEKRLLEFCVKRNVVLDTCLIEVASKIVGDSDLQ